MAQNPQVKAALKDRGLNENYGARADGAAYAGRRTADYTQAGCDAGGEGVYGMDDRRRRRRAATFQFDERRHEPGTKMVLGKTIKENGENEGLRGAAYAGDESGDGEVHFDQAGGAVCER